MTPRSLADEAIFRLPIAHIISYCSGEPAADTITSMVHRLAWPDRSTGQVAVMLSAMPCSDMYIDLAATLAEEGWTCQEVGSGSPVWFPPVYAVAAWQAANGVNTHDSA